MQNWTPKKIEQFRGAYKLSRRALGEFLGVTGNCIYQWERGLREPNKTSKLLLSRVADDFKKKKKGG